MSISREPGRGKIRVVLVDGQILFRESLASLLAGEVDFEVAAQYEAAEQAAGKIKAREVDVIIASPEAARTLVKSMRHSGALVKLLEITESSDVHDALLAMRRGASGVIAQNTPADSLAMAVRAVASGSVWYDHKVIQSLAEAWLAPGRNSRLYYSDREEQVLEGICDGLTNRTIAAKAGLTEGIVKATVRQLLRRAGAKTRSQLVGSTLSRGDPPPSARAAASPGRWPWRDRTGSG
jgi:DNA-binding NarL/FixJ family response regulator